MIITPLINSTNEGEISVLIKLKKKKFLESTHIAITGVKGIRYKISSLNDKLLLNKGNFENLIFISRKE